MKKTTFNETTIKNSIKATLEKIEQLITSNPTDFFTKLKFEQTAYLPYENNNKKVETNFIEFLNQLFTSVISLMANQYIQNEMGKEWEPIYAIGEANGRDIRWEHKHDKKTIIAEVFAVTKSKSNSKLKDDIKALCKNKAEDGNVQSRYIFFILAQNEFADLTDKDKCIKKILSMTAYCSKATKEKIIVQEEDIIRNVENRAVWKCKHEKDNKSTEITIVCFSQNSAQSFLSEIRNNNQ